MEDEAIVRNAFSMQSLTHSSRSSSHDLEVILKIGYEKPFSGRRKRESCQAMAQFEATRELVGRPLVPFYIGDTDEVNESLETFNER